MRSASQFTCVICVLMFAMSLGSCSGCDVLPQQVNATAEINGRDGLSQNTSETLTLTHDPSAQDQPRVVTKRFVIAQIKGFTVNVTRTGIPFEESFVLYNISNPGFAPGADAPSAAISSGDYNYILDHVGRIDAVHVDTARLDSPLTAERPNVFEGRQRGGYAFFARWHAADPCMPFSDSSALIDVSRLTSKLFDTLSDVVTDADDESDQFSLGGPEEDGAFEMFFVPYTEHSLNGPAGGFTLIFKASIVAATVSADVYIPLSFLFSRVRAGTAIGDFLEHRIGLINISDSDDRRRVSVIARGLFEEGLAPEIRRNILDGIDDIPDSRREEIGLAQGLFEAALNAIRPNQGQGPLPTNVRVVLFPNYVPPGAKNRIMPVGNGSLQPKLCILQTTP